MSDETCESELLTLDQAAEQLGWAGRGRRPGGGPTARARRLRAAIEARQKETGFRIMHRRPSYERSPIRISMLALREHLPELFRGERMRLHDEGRFARVLRSIDERIAERCDPLDDRLTKVEHHGSVTREMLYQLGETIGGIRALPDQKTQK